MDRKSCAVWFLLWLIGLGLGISASVSEEAADQEAKPAQEPESSAVAADEDAAAAAKDMQVVFEQLGKAAQQSSEEAVELALRILRQTGSLRPASDSIAAAVRQRAIAVLKQAGRLDEIIASLEQDYQGAADASKVVSLADALAELYEAKGDRDGAATMYQKILEHLPSDPQANFKLAGWYHQREQHPQMIVALEVAWENDPELALREAPRIGRYYADANQGDLLIRRIEALDDATLLQRYGDRLRYFAQAFSRSRDQTDVAIRTYAAILRVLPIRFRCELALDYGSLLERRSRLQAAYDVYKLGFFPASSGATDDAYTVPEQRAASVLQTGEVLSPMVALADLAERMQALDRLETETAESLQKTPAWKPTGELFLAMLHRRQADEQPIADLGSRCLDEPDDRAAGATLMNVLRQELSKCKGAGPLRVAKSLWRELAETGEDYQVEAALHQQALIELNTGHPEQARRLWLKIVDRLGETKRSVEQGVQARYFAADQLQAHGFQVDALRLARQILQTDQSSFSAHSYASYLIERTERRLVERLRHVRAGNFKFPKAEQGQVLTILLGLLFKEGTQKDTEFGSGLDATTTTLVAELVVGLAKTAGQLGRLRQQWDAHPMADSLGLLALRAEAAVADGDQQVAERLLARISDLEQSTGTTAPLWSPACLFHGFDEKLKAEFRDDLSEGELDARVFRFPRKLKQHIQKGSDGLCLHAPPGTKALSIRFTPVLRGDFEVTASYAIPDATRPDELKGSGATVRVWSEDGKRQLAGLFAVNGLEADEGGRYLMNRGHLEGEKRDIRTQTVPTSSRSGTLRVVRKGATLYFLAAENESSEFRRLHQIPFSDEDIAGTRLGVHCLDPAAGMEVQWKDLVIRAEQIVGLPELAPEPRARAWWLVVVLALLLAGGGLWWLVRAKRARSG